MWQLIYYSLILFIGEHGDVIYTPWGQCIVDAGGYIFNTEAHPIDPGALHCCQHPHNLFPQTKSKLRKFVAVNDRRNEDPGNVKFFEDDINKREDSNRTIKIEKLSDIKKSELSENINDTKQTDTTESEEISIKKETETFEANVSADSSNYKVRVMAPPSAIYKADDSENVETLVTASRATAEFPTSNDDTSNKSESMKIDKTTTEKIYFDPQVMLERIRKNNLYPSNLTAKEDFQLLSCQSQPFLQRISIVGEFF